MRRVVGIDIPIDTFYSVYANYGRILMAGNKLPSEETVNRALAVLRDLTDKTRVREDEQGRAVADIVFNGRIQSLERLVPPEKLSASTLKACLRLLVRATLVAPGVPGTHRRPRWVVLEGTFSFDAIAE